MDKQDFLIFKLNRILELNLFENTFVPKCLLIRGLLVICFPLGRKLKSLNQRI